ncbi:hypothetical protein PHMEG_00026060 [Phytophthora megakarya]|uniref:CCHC-type domain-containing protein n=1 Tax=Phytophthora megakarya TaxID=4795 RepID=A0A225VBR0_9STRA|nr:hypothetical protein PHMEG_00026060 [Phytophthora megakarya]
MDEVLEEASEVVAGESGLDEPGQASIEDADLEVSRMEGRVSDSSPLDQDVSPEAQPDVQAELLSPVPDTKPVEDEVVATLEEKLQPELEPSTELVQVEPQAETTSADWTNKWRRRTPPRKCSGGSKSARSKSTAQREVFMAPRPSGLLRLGERGTGYVEVLGGQSCRGSPAQLWVHELAPDRRDLATAQGLIGVQVTSGLITPRECVAILQTMLYEAVFQFQNLVPVWFRVHAAKVSPGVIRSLVRPALEAQARSEPPQVLDYHPEDEDGDLIMTDQPQADAETKMQADRAVWEAPTRQSMEELEQRLKESEAARMEDQRTAKNIQEFHEVEVRSEPGLKNVPGVVLDQLRATLPAADFARLARNAKPVEVKTEARREELAPRTKQDAPARSHRHADATDVKSKTKKKPSKSKRTKVPQKKPRRVEDPSDSSGSSSSEESSDESSDSSEDSLNEDTHALDFFYRLNEAAVKAGIKYRKSKKEREDHIKRFLKNLKDCQLKVQDRDAVVDGYDSSSSQKRDFRADNIPSSRHRPKGRAFIGLSEDEAGWESEGHVRCEDEVEEPTPTEQDIHNAVYRAMENAGSRLHQSGSQSGWQSPRPGWQSPRPNNPDRNEFCEKCMKFGHKEHNSWIDMVCERCGKNGHPGHACRARPCPYCDKCHQDKCEDFETMGTMKNLARNGVLKSVPLDILKKLLNGKAVPLQ